jgi:hypothetical protein
MGWEVGGRRCRVGGLGGRRCRVDERCRVDDLGGRRCRVGRLGGGRCRVGGLGGGRYRVDGLGGGLQPCPPAGPAPARGSRLPARCELLLAREPIFSQTHTNEFRGI